MLAFFFFFLYKVIKVKRRWDDDVVFKNCAKGIEERKKEQVFINDAIRSEFHKKFMEKYIKWLVPWSFFSLEFRNFSFLLL